MELMLRPYESSRAEAFAVAIIIAVSALVVLAYAPGCRVDSKPRVTTWSRAQPPVVLHGPAKLDEDGGPR